MTRRSSSADPTIPPSTPAGEAAPTRLEAMPDDLQERLINWVYAVCDAALRKHCNDDNTILPPKGIFVSREGCLANEETVIQDG